MLTMLCFSFSLYRNTFLFLGKKEYFEIIKQFCHLFFFIFHQIGLVEQWETELLMDMALMYKNEQQTKMLKELKKTVYIKVGSHEVCGGNS